MQRHLLIYRGAVYRKAETDGDRYRLRHFNEPSFTTTIEDLEGTLEESDSPSEVHYPDRLQTTSYMPADDSWVAPWWLDPSGSGKKSLYPPTYQGVNFRRLTARSSRRAEGSDPQARALARKLTVMLAELSGKPVEQLVGWEKRARKGVHILVKPISDLLNTSVAVEVHLASYRYMEALFGHGISIYNAAAATIIQDDTVMVVLPLLSEGPDGGWQVQQIDTNTKQEIFHEFIHAIDYTQDFETAKQEQSKLSDYSTESPREFKAYFLSMADQIEEYVEQRIAFEKKRHVFLSPDVVEKLGPERAAAWFWKNQVGWTDLASFKQYSYDNYISSRWLYYLSPAGKTKADQALDELWNYLEQRYGSPKNPSKTIELTQ